MPLPLLIPIAAAAVAGGTALAKGLSNRTKVSEADKARLAELRRMEELGALGLSDEELAVMRDRRLSPVDAAQREAQMRMASSRQVGDLGSGASYAGQIALSDAAGEQRQTALRDIQAADVARAGEMRQEATALAKSIEQQQQARKKETTQSVIGAVDAAAQAGFGASTGLMPALPKSAPVDIGGVQMTPEQATEMQKYMQLYGVV